MEGVRELEDLPVIFISAYGRDETIVRALDAGAADYIVKPFSPSELTARVRSALRRRVEPEPFLLGDLAIHYEERRVTVADRPVTLTVTEFEVLRVLSTSAGRVVTYESLLGRAWGRRNRGSGDPRVVRAIVKSLRRKLGDDAANPAYVRNERGVGYRMPRPGRIVMPRNPVAGRRRGRPGGGGRGWPDAHGPGGQRQPSVHQGPLERERVVPRARID